MRDEKIAPFRATSYPPPPQVPDIAEEIQRIVVGLSADKQAEILKLIEIWLMKLD
jgi:hypothetical protein